MKRMKKANILIVLIAALCLLVILPTVTTGAETAVGDNIVRVHLNSYGDPASVTLNAAGSYTIVNTGQPASGSFTLSASGSGIKLTVGGVASNLGGDVYIKAASLSAGNLLQINGGYKYAGDMRILNKSGKLKLINYVDIETYVMGVLPYEMNDSWPIEALKAQAVAARSYAYYTTHSRVRTTVEQDLVNSTLHQVYLGYNASNANCIAAVKATKNMVMKTPTGQNVYACYSASNGGMTEFGATSGASSQNFDYLTVKEDPWDLAYALGTNNYSGKLTIPKKISAPDLTGSNAEPYKMLRGKLKAAGVDMSAINGNVTVKKIELVNPRYTKPDRQFLGAKMTLTIPGGRDVTLSFGPISISGSSTQYPFLNDILGLGKKFSILALKEENSSWVIASARYGHGAGMSQIGAYQMAKSGKNYDDILKFYYGLGKATVLVTMPWDGSGGTAPGVPGYTVTKVSKAGKVNTPGTTLNVRGGPGTGNPVVTSLKDGAKVTITGQVADWWRIDLGGGKSGFVLSGFIKLDTNSQQTTEKEPDKKPDPEKPETKDGTVNTPGTTLNVRSGPSTSAAIIASLKHGDKVTVTDENTSWYKLTVGGKTGYVNKAFINLGGTGQGADTSKGKTVYVNTPGMTLNVRSGPGTSYAILGALKHGEKITVTDADASWYKITYSGKAGYVSKAYTKADDPQSSSGSQGSASSKTVYVNTPGMTLNVRSGPGTSYAVLGSLKHGEKITVTEENASWYKLTFGGKTGYVSKSYISNEAVSSAQPAPATPKAGTVNAPLGLNVRSGPGTSYKTVGSLPNGAKVTIVEQSGSWYKIRFGSSEAWVSSSYVKV
ncbi:MAG: SH3 domain-containing protein [Clostridiales bacterium]|nr:SH3 domain-containing protein [Clostridiales bacterium]